MCVCNIVYDPNIEWDSEDGKVIGKYNRVPSINCVVDITHLDTSVPTLFYGYNVTKKHIDLFDRANRQINTSYWWTYNHEEISFECWVDEFVEWATKLWFDHIDNGIDVVFDEFNVDEFVDHLDPWPLIHEGGYEIYIADWRDRKVVIHSIKKDTLEYAGIVVRRFLHDIYERLGYRFLTIEATRWKWEEETGQPCPIFLDAALYAFTDQWQGINEIIDYFSHIKIDRKKVITYYMKQSEFLRPKFDLYFEQ